MSMDRGSLLWVAFMRLLAVLGGCLVLVTAASAHGDGGDRHIVRRAGLWETSSSINGVFATTGEKCEAENIVIPTAIGSHSTINSGNCAQTVQIDLSGASSEITCSDGHHVKIGMSSTDPEHVSGFMNISNGAGPTIRTSFVSHWVGPCPADMQDGQIKNNSSTRKQTSPEAP